VRRAAKRAVVTIVSPETLRSAAAAPLRAEQNRDHVHRVADAAAFSRVMLCE
jgi:hypothetical protein